MRVNSQRLSEFCYVFKREAKEIVVNSAWQINPTTFNKSNALVMFFALVLLLVFVPTTKRWELVFLWITQIFVPVTSHNFVPVTNLLPSLNGGEQVHLAKLHAGNMVLFPSFLVCCNSIATWQVPYAYATGYHTRATTLSYVAITPPPFTNIPLFDYNLRIKVDRIAHIVHLIRLSGVLAWMGKQLKPCKMPKYIDIVQYVSSSPLVS